MNTLLKMVKFQLTGNHLKRNKATKHNRMYNYLYYICLFCLSVSFGPYHTLIFNQFVNQISGKNKNTIFNIAITFAVYYFGFMDCLYYFSIIKIYDVLGKCDSCFTDKVYSSLSDSEKKLISNCKEFLNNCCIYVSSSSVVVSINSNIDNFMICYGIDKYLEKIDHIEETNSEDDNLIKEISSIVTNLEKNINNSSFNRRQRRRT